MPKYLQILIVAVVAISLPFLVMADTTSIQYEGEHLLPGKIGHFAIVLSFVAALLSSISFFFSTQRRHQNEEANSWRKIGRIAFVIHGLSVFTVIGIIFYIMSMKYYEYQYVWAHVSEDLPYKYIFSAFWEGQEGSFLLWMFWHVVLGFVLMKTAKKWEAPVLSVIAFVQLIIGSMILGIVFDFGMENPFKLGSNPLLLLRDTMEAPIFNNAAYLSLIKGTGLNPLLQNYWMTIHPPTLFLGFASTVVPFAYAIAGLWTKEHKAWLKPVMRWSLFSGAILGTGILMGGAWAYEALSFGGYWAWDPVENMSLVPWIVLIAGIHTNLIASKTGYSIKSTYLYYILSFALIIYSTFLTRSGVLGDTSVHAFTEMGLEWQLVIFLGLIFGLGLYSYFKNKKSIPVHEKEEVAVSREFWMFIGSLVLLFSAVLISFTTSIPVYNKILDFVSNVFTLNLEEYKRSSPLEPVAHYNKFQLWIAVFIGFLSGIAQYLRYKGANWKGYKNKFTAHLAGALVVSAFLTFIISMYANINAWQYLLLTGASIFACVSNLDVLINFMKFNLKIASSTLAHLGFGLMILGVIFSGLNQEIISKNQFAFAGILDDDDIRNNVILKKGAPVFMNGYEVTYVQDTSWDNSREFTINYKRKDDKGNNVEEFDLHPHILYTRDFSKVASSNPSIKRYWNKDIFTNIASLPPQEISIENAKAIEDTIRFEKYPSKIGDTIYTQKYFAVVEDIFMNAAHEDYQAQAGDLSLGVNIRFHSLSTDASWLTSPVIALRKSLIYNFPFHEDDLGIRVKVDDAILDGYLTAEDKLDYQSYDFKIGESININQYQIVLKGLDTKKANSAYVPEEGDIKVAAVVEITNVNSNKTANAYPLYVIRGKQQFQLKDFDPGSGFHFRFNNIDPTTEIANLEIAWQDINNMKLPVEISENAPSGNYVVMKAIVFPGINLFWIGSILMMTAMFLGSFFKPRT